MAPIHQATYKSTLFCKGCSSQVIVFTKLELISSAQLNRVSHYRIKYTPITQSILPVGMKIGRNQTFLAFYYNETSITVFFTKREPLPTRKPPM